MNLYHFTAHDYLSDILREGLRKGDVPLSPTEGLNSVWLTTDGQADGHGLSEHRELTIEEKRRAGVSPDDPVWLADKRAIRLTVRIASTDRRLCHWTKWARKRLSPKWIEILNETGGGKARTWYLYWGTIHPDKFIDVLDLRYECPAHVA